MVTKTEYDKALKTVQSKKSESSYLLVNLSYDAHLVLPYKAGIAFLESLEQAEQYNNSYHTKKGIRGLEKDKITSSILSAREYQRIKIAALLGVNESDLPEENALTDNMTC